MNNTIRVFNFGRRLSMCSIKALEERFPDQQIDEFGIRYDIDLQGNVYDQTQKYVEEKMEGLVKGQRPVIALGGLSIGMAYLIAYLAKNYEYPVIVETIKMASQGGMYGLKGLYNSIDGTEWLGEL